jgi:hypothetical protein
VRLHYRRLICSRLPGDPDQLRKLPKADRAARVFGDTTGRWWSLDELAAAIAEKHFSSWWFTFAAPPYPERDYGRPILCFAETEDVSALRRAVPLYNRTTFLLRDLEGEQRARAPQLDAFALGPEQRQRCLRVIDLERNGLVGQVGILAPAHAADRGLRVHTHRRPLCTLGDGPGWPLCAVLNDDGLRPSRAFDGLSSRKQARAVRERIREAATAELQQWLRAPPQALASRWIDSAVPVAEDEDPSDEAASSAKDGSAAAHVVGSLCLPATWPERPALRIRSASAPEGNRIPLRPLSRPPQLDGRLPVEGELLVLPTAEGGADLHGTVVDLALGAIEQMLAEAGSSELPSAELDRYRWDLALLGRPGGEAPVAPTCDGASVGPDQVLQELSTRGVLWYSEQRGSVAGAFPTEPPSFVLLGCSALLEVLTQRALRGVLRELGGLTVETAGAALEAGAELGSTALAVAGLPGAEAAAPLELQPETATAPDTLSGLQTPVDPSWLDGLVQQVRSWFSPTGEPLAVGARVELTDAVLDALERLALTGEPVAAVQCVSSGRPVRYDRNARRILLNHRHPVVSALGRQPLEPTALAMLVAAAVGEVNRALEAVTDSEECRALADLLAAKPTVD